MMITPPEIPKDDDVILIFRLTETGQRRRHGQMTWGAAKKAILDLQPTVQGAPGVAGKDGAPGVAGKDGAPGVAGKDGAPVRVERYTGNVTGTQGVATLSFPEFAAPPLGKVIDGWSGEQQITGMVTNTTRTGATVAVRRSRGTLALSSGPFEIAPAGTPVTIEIIGK